MLKADSAFQRAAHADRARNQGIYAARISFVAEFYYICGLND